MTATSEMASSVTPRVLRKRRAGVGQGAGLPATLVVCVIAALSMFPFAFLLIRSLAAHKDLAIGGLWLVIFDRMPVLRYSMNSAIVSLGATAIVLVVSSMAGFSFAKLGFRFSGLCYVLMIAAISVPLATVILPNYLNFAKLGGVGTYWGPILMYAALATPFSVVLMTSFFQALPDELMESAVVDGASYWQIYTLIMMRMAGSALVTVGVLCFLGTWNDLLIGLLMLPDPDMRTISVGVATLKGVRATAMDNDIILTGSLMSTIPPIIAFILFQRHIVTGITAGITK